MALTATFHPSGAGKLFCKLVETVHELCREVNFHCGPNGIWMQAMDSSHVCVITFNLDAEGFKHFECESDMKIGINLSNLIRVLKCIDKDDEITMQYTSESDVMQISYSNESKKRRGTFDMRLMDIEADMIDISDFEHAALVTLSSSEYAKLMRDLASIGDNLLITADVEEGVTLRTSGDCGVASIRLEKTEKMEIHKHASTLYAIRYLNTFAKASALSDEVDMYITPDMPIRLSFKLADMGMLQFYLAPKMGDDDDDNDDAGPAEDAASSS